MESLNISLSNGTKFLISLKLAFGPKMSDSDTIISNLADLSVTNTL